MGIVDQADPAFEAQNDILKPFRCGECRGKYVNECNKLGTITALGKVFDRIEKGMNENV